MKVFLSSVIGGMEEYRAAARQAAETLGHTVVAAEDFRVSPNRNAAHCPGRPLQPNGDLGRPGGPDGEGQVKSQARSALGETPYPSGDQC